METELQELQGRILIVDDNPTNLLLLEQLLKQNGYTNISCQADSRVAVETYQDFKPDLVLLDLNMPFKDGFQVMEELRDIEHGSYPPILVLTANTDHQARIRALERGALDFLTKPFNMVEVLVRIKNMMTVRLLHNKIQSQNKVLDEKVRERTQQLVNAQVEVVKRLGLAAEFRDNETGMHVVRMSHFSALLGKAVGMAREECDILLQASPMHDIGKIGIPDRILLKPGKLNPDEWEIMKTHALIGAKILSGAKSKIMKVAETIARTHHEKWDGSGYPYALKGEETPLEGRIVAIADVFDALTSDRPYKKAWSVSETLLAMEQNSGSHFDPFLFEKFKTILPEILEIKDQFADTSEEPQVVRMNSALLRPENTAQQRN
jgi:putative two-component system response regulator